MYVYMIIVTIHELTSVVHTKVATVPTLKLLEACEPGKSVLVLQNKTPLNLSLIAAPYKQRYVPCKRLVCVYSAHIGTIYSYEGDEGGES